MDIATWGRANFLFPGPVIKLTVSGFKQLIGQPGGFTAKFNEEEREFFNELYPKK